MLHKFEKMLGLPEDSLAKGWNGWLNRKCHILSLSV